MVQGLKRKLAAPVACGAVLAGMLAEHAARATPRSAAPYHAAARAAIDAVPVTITDRAGATWSWDGKDLPLPTAAVQLLRPNAYLSRRYVLVTGDRPLEATLLIVQTQESRDMVGHYPRNCYPANGFELVREPEPFDRVVNGLRVPATEYTFRILKGGGVHRQTVYNFLIVPGVGIVPDIRAVERAAEDYQDRYFGAAQYQVVLPADLPRDVRERAYDALIGANVAVIRTLTDRDAGQPPQQQQPLMLTQLPSGGLP